MGWESDPRALIETGYTHARVVPFNLRSFEFSKQLGPPGSSWSAAARLWSSGLRGDLKRSDPALMVVYASLMRDGRPTIESFNVAGGSDLGQQLGAASRSCGVITGHRTSQDHLSLIYWADDGAFTSTPQGRQSASASWPGVARARIQAGPQQQRRRSRQGSEPAAVGERPQWVAGHPDPHPCLPGERKQR
jgi:hypothetical protein